MKIRKLSKIIAIVLAIVMCFGATYVNAAAPAQTTVPETAYMKRIAASELPFEFVIEASNLNSVLVSYNRTVLLIPVNEVMYINDKTSGDVVQAVDGCFELEYNKVYKFSYQYENGVLKYCYDGELSYACSDNMPIMSIDNLYLNSMSKVVEQGGISLNSTTAASAGSMYESENNNSYYVADVTYDNYDNYGKISTAADEDWWKITFAHEGKANFWLGNIPSGCDYDLMVYDSNGTTIVGASISAGSASELISGLEITAGTYYMRVLWGEDGCSDTNYYLLRAKWYQPTYVWTFNVYDSETGLRHTGYSSLEIRGHNDNFNVSIYNGYGSVELTPGRTVGFNVRAEGYFSYVYPSKINVSGDESYNVFLDSVDGVYETYDFISPFDNFNEGDILSPFGWRSWLNDNLYDGKEFEIFDKHTGIDLPKVQETVIKSICDVNTTEFFSGWDDSMGNYVKVIDYESSCIIRYMHMVRQFFMPEDGFINQGECIGNVGSTGNSRGPHLHIDININGVYYEPQHFWGA